MLILCIGPDTFRAQAKALELEAAFREKYDKSGSSTERLSPGKDAADEVIERANTVSLFSPRRFLRTSLLLAECPKAKQPALVQALSRDPEHVIVVSVEPNVLASTIMKAFEKVPKIIKYDFAEQQGTAFREWLEAVAKNMGVTDASSVRFIAESCEGDSWSAWNELMKVAAGGKTETDEREASPTLYQYADAFLRGSPQRFTMFGDADALGQALQIFLSQGRSALRVRDGAAQTLHPYVSKKLRSMDLTRAEYSFCRTLMALLVQRAGLGSEEDTALLLD